MGGPTTIGNPLGEGNNGASVTTALTDQGEVVSTSTVSSKSRTVETVTVLIKIHILLKDMS